MNINENIKIERKMAIKIRGCTSIINYNSLAKEPRLSNLVPS